MVPVALDYEATGTAVVIVASAAVAILAGIAACTSVTVYRGGRNASLILTCQYGAVVCGTLSIAGVVAQYSRRWDPEADAIACGFLPRWSGVLYFMEMAFALQFLHARVLLATPGDAGTPLMRALQLGIYAIVPFATVTAILSEGRIMASTGFCLPYYPTVITVLVVVAVAAFGASLVYKFYTALVVHSRARAGAAGPDNGTDIACEGQNMYQVAVKNVVCSSIAMACTLSTGIFFMMVDFLYGGEPTPLAVIGDLCGVVDMVVNILALCVCSYRWMPKEVRACVRHARQHGASIIPTPH